MYSKLDSSSLVSPQKQMHSSLLYLDFYVIWQKLDMCLDFCVLYFIKTAFTNLCFEKGINKFFKKFVFELCFAVLQVINRVFFVFCRLFNWIYKIITIPSVITS